MAPLLTVNNLHKRFGGVNASDDINLEVVEGELHGIIGPNGAGKTTLISQLCGSVLPDSGEITFDGANITNLAQHRRAKLGMTRSFQITSLLMDMTVLDNVALGVQARQTHSFKFFKPAQSIKELRDEAANALDQIGLNHRADVLTKELSHGEHRQLEIAVALATGAKLMLLDEPMAGLGPTESARMISFLKELKSKRTILLIEHDMDAVFALADRISVLVYGKIIATGSPNEIRNDAAVRHAYLGEE